MANNNSVTIEFSPMIVPETFSGEKCTMCDDQVYGEGFRLVMVISYNKSLTPAFKETDVIMCSSCRHTLEW